MSPAGLRRPLAALCLAALLVPAVAAAAVQDGEGVTYLGTAFVGEPFALGGDVVLETDGDWCTLRDYGAPALPGWIAWYRAGDSGALWREVFHEDGLAAVLREELDAGVLLLDASDPAALQPLAAITGSTYTGGLLHDELLYLALPSLLLVYELGDPAAPAYRFAATLAAREEGRPVAAAGGVACVQETATGLRLLDVSDPLAIADLGPFGVTGDRIDALAASAGALHLLVATDTGSDSRRVDLVTLDVTVPAAPVEVDRQELASGPGARGLQLQRRDQLLLAADNLAGTHAFDVSVPAQPLAGAVLPVAAERLAITAGRVLVRTADRLLVYERRPAAETPPLLAERRILPRLRQLSGSGPVLVAQPEKDHSVLLCIDPSDPAAPRVVAELDTGLGGELVHDDALAVMVSDDDLQVVDLADPAAPRLRGVLRLSRGVGGAGAMLCDDLLALPAATADVVVLVDLGDRDAPAELGVIEEVERVLATGPSLLLLQAAEQALIYARRDPDPPLPVGPLPLGGTPLAVALAGPRAYALVDAAGTGQLEVIDLSDPAAPVRLSSRPLAVATELKVVGRRLYAIGTQRVDILDIAAWPGPPPTAAWLAPAFSPRRLLAVHEDLVLCGAHLVSARDETWRPVAVRTPPPATGGRLLSARPNPFNPRTSVRFELAAPRTATVAVYDLRGRRLATLAEGRLSAGTHELAWDGRDAGGRPLPAGTYLVRLAGAGLESALPVCLVK